MGKRPSGLVRSKTNVCLGLGIVILCLFFQIAPLAARNAFASGMPRIAAGGLHTIAMKPSGTVWTWGNNSYGQLGDGTRTDSSSPVQVSGLNGVIGVAGGFWHTVALKSDGTVWTWGSNKYGQLGNGDETDTDSSAPVEVSGLSDAIAVAGGYWHTVALKSDGTVWTWGNNFYGQLGDGTNTDGKTPVQVSGLSDVLAIASGYWHTIALKSDGTVWTWGNNTYGQLGDGSTVHSATPVQVSGLSGVDTNVDNVTSIAGGYWHTIALKTDGTVWAWGNNFYGQLGDGTDSDCSTPLQVAPQPPTVRTDSATNVTYDSATLNGMANANGLETKVWFEYGKAIGNYTDTSAILTIKDDESINKRINETVRIGISDLSENTTYYYRIFAENGGGWAWGSVLSFTTTSAPAAVARKSARESDDTRSGSAIWNVIAIAGGGGHTAALRTDGSVWSWGSNYDGQLGDGTNSDSSTPVLISKLSGIITSIASGNWHTVALRSDGTVWTWGSNYNGQLGDGTFGRSNTPVQVKNFNMGLTIGRIYGYVVDVNGDPLTLANLRLSGKKTKTSKSTLSDKNGYFEFKDLRADIYSILAKKKGYNQAKSVVVLQTGEIKEIEIEMKPKKGNGSSATPTPISSPSPTPLPTPTPSLTPLPSPTSTPAKAW